MKRLAISLMLLVAAAGSITAQNDAMYVYRNDGTINAFLKADIDSICHSNIDLDSLTHAEVVVQEVWTADSIYRIPLTAIDSVSFITPPTVYKRDVIRIEESLLDYVIGADGLTLLLKPNTPTMLLPLAGDKLVLLEGCEALPYGFSGVVSSVEQTATSINIICEQAYLEDLFDSFCSVQTILGCNPDSVASPSSRRRVTYRPDDIVFSLGPYTVSRSDEVSREVKKDSDLALKGGVSVSTEVQPTFRIHTLLILGEGHGTYFNCSITGDLRVTSRTSFYGGIDFNHDFDGLIAECPIPYTANLVKFYINPGLFIRADATLTGTLTSTQLYTFGMAYDYSSKGENTVKPSIGGRLAGYSTDVSGSLDGSVAGGLYLETGFNVVSRKLAKVYARGEAGVRFSGSFVLRNSDIDNASKETKLYERLKQSSVELGTFVNFSLGASVLQSGAGRTWELYEPIHTWDLVPEFSGTKLTQGSGASLDALAQVSGDCLFPVGVGFSLLDDDMEKVADHTVGSYKNKPTPIEHSFSGLDKDRLNDYTVYPKVRFLGFDILASPEAKLSLFACPDGNHPHAIDLGLPSGTKWCCCNVGANTPEGYGGYYAWGETSEKDYYYWDSYKYYKETDDDWGYTKYSTNSSYGYNGFTDGKTQLDSSDDVAHVKMGAPWRMPTVDQMKELVNNCSRQWTQVNGVNGILVTGPSGGQVFLPAAGYRWDDNLGDEGGYGYYWSSSLYPGYSDGAYGLGFYSSYWYWYSWYGRNDGHSVRAVRP